MFMNSFRNKCSYYTGVELIAASALNFHIVSLKQSLGKVIFAGICEGVPKNIFGLFCALLKMEAKKRMAVSLRYTKQILTS